MSEKDQKSQFTKKRSDEGYYQEQYDELDREKPVVVIDILKRCVKRSIIGSYVLMDRWFGNDYMLKEIRKIRNGLLHVVGLCKMDKQQFESQLAINH